MFFLLHGARTWTLRQFLQQAVEIRRPGNALVEAMYRAGGLSLELLAKHDLTSAELCAQFVADNDLSLDKLLLHFVDPALAPVGVLRLDDLLRHCHFIQQRLYSIASSPKHSPRSLDLTIRLLIYTVEHAALEGDSGARVGFATSYLASEDFDAAVDIFIRPNSSFHPVGQEAILIGAGSGVAPFRGFWQNWAAKPGSIKRATIFLGWRSPDSEAYAQEIATVQGTIGAGADGAELLAFPCYSRKKNTPKMYVQDGLVAQAALVWGQLEAGAHIFICGQSKLAREATHSLNRIAAQNGAEKPQHFASRLTSEGRLHLDVFTDLAFAKQIPEALSAPVPAGALRRMTSDATENLPSTEARRRDSRASLSYLTAMHIDKSMQKAGMVDNAVRRSLSSDDAAVPTFGDETGLPLLRHFTETHGDHE